MGRLTSSLGKSWAKAVRISAPYMPLYFCACTLGTYHLSTVTTAPL